jgi:hypothetical protein
MLFIGSHNHGKRLNSKLWQDYKESYFQKIKIYKKWSKKNVNVNDSDIQKWTEKDEKQGLTEHNIMAMKMMKIMTLGLVRLNCG